MSRTIALGLLLLLTGSTSAPAASLKPATVKQFFFTPQKPATLQWRVESGELKDPIEYTLRDYTGKTISSGRAKRAADGAVEATLRLDQGFYEIEFPAAGQRFGIVALPAHSAKADPFFCIDGGLSWLVKDDAIREGLIDVAHRSGIAMIRERLTWGAVHPAQDKWDWEGGARFDTLRRTYQKHGVEVLEMAHDGPKWLGRVGKYPENLVDTMQSWQKIATHWRPAWGALEIWNEPDIFFGGDLPADQYVALAKAVSYGLAEAKADVPVVGGVMAHCNQTFLDSCAKNGLLNYLDAFSFHTYGQALEMEPLVAKYRQWLRDNERGNMPLWITECGRPWKVGPERPPVDQDAASALDIIMKGVEARACGIGRYFAFVYPYYEENTNNFGMMDKRATPLRAMAAYAQMIQALAGQPYLGNLKLGDPAIQRARVFGGQDRVVAVLYTGKPQEVRFKFDMLPQRIEGIDGRPLVPSADGTISIPDGLAYLWFDRSALGSRLAANTPARQLHPSPVSDWKPWWKSRTESPLILRYEYDPALVEPSSEGYRIKAPLTKNLPFRVRVFNLSKELRTVDYRLTFSSEEAENQRGLKPWPRVPMVGSSDVTWPLALNRVFLKEEHLDATLTVKSEFFSDQLSVRFLGQNDDLFLTLQMFQHWLRLPIQESSRWTPSIAGHGEMTIDSTSEAPWRLQAKFKEKDRWVYPSFKLPDNVKLDQNTGLVIRARCHKPATVRVFLWEGDTGVGYLTPKSIVPADGQWHVGRVRFSNLVLSTANAPDSNGRLDLDQVRRIAIGMNSDAPENTLEVSDVCVVDAE